MYSPSASENLKLPQHQGTCCSGRGKFLETRKTLSNRPSQDSTLVGSLSLTLLYLVRKKREILAPVYLDVVVSTQ